MDYLLHNNCAVASCGINYFVGLRHCLRLLAMHFAIALWPHVSCCMVTMLRIVCACRENLIFALLQ